MLPVSLRRAWDIRRACRPGSASPMSPSISLFGVRAATESTTIRSTEPERTRASAISRACSPVSGCESRRFGTSTPRRFAYWMSNACSASMKAQVPPSFCISAMTWSVSVVFPEDSGPNTSMIRPRGRPPTPSARSSPSEPVDTVSMSSISVPSAMRMIAPLPNCFSMLASATLSAFLRSSPSTRVTRSVFVLLAAM